MTFPQPGERWNLFVLKTGSIIVSGDCPAVATECGDFQQCHRCSTAERCPSDGQSHSWVTEFHLSLQSHSWVTEFFKYHSHTLSLCLNFTAKQHWEKQYLPLPLMCNHGLSWQEAEAFDPGRWHLTLAMADKMSFLQILPATWWESLMRFSALSWCHSFDFYHDLFWVPHDIFEWVCFTAS